MNRALRTSLLTLNVLAGVAVVGATLLLCGGAILFALLNSGTGYSVPTTAAAWIREISRSSSNILFLSTTLAVALIVACAATVAAAMMRRTAWIVTGGVCGILLALTQIGVASTSTEVDALASRAIAAVGNTTAVEPQPGTEAERDSITVSDAYDEMTRMLRATLEAAAPPVVGENGAPLTVDQVEVDAASCGEDGSQLSAALTLSTGDNAASLSAILGAWDRAGYLPDRAMQEDLRYSTTLPLERMSIRDKTTIDGYIHIAITSACAVADR
ncbi:hypothetical protein FHX49_001359 [Microbacterium endophyticum]|uniref:Uncharacterized protein n=1 Tax=Microbacterium endophyticum TaxID=1526412 RepID=A0A7W4V2S9_9MICO|nr:hypothetical protein [Microbacterium endophyticum]MBB2975792.1 hypothetical protein [Microbacterium endophyticum]NIK36275.1 hypothetical protein [Microbacterium endophyticum]